MAGGVMGALADLGASLYGAAWEMRRGAYQRGWLKPQRVASRVVSIGNLTAGGTGKTTLTLHLARRALERGLRCAVVCRDYRADARGMSDEAYLYREALEPQESRGDAPVVFVGRRKAERSAAAAAAGATLTLVDDGFSTWSLERDLDLVLLDARDPWGGGALLPKGRLREPRRALQRAEVVVISRLSPGQDPAPLLAEARRFAPAACLAAGRHAPRGAEPLEPGSAAPATRRVRVVTGTGNPESVAATAREAGFEVVALARYRDHHWFSDREARAEVREAERAGAVVLVTAKDAVRWKRGAPGAPALVLRVAWEWVSGGEAVERAVLEGAR